MRRPAVLARLLPLKGSRKGKAAENSYGAISVPRQQLERVPEDTVDGEDDERINWPPADLEEDGVEGPDIWNLSMWYSMEERYELLSRLYAFVPLTSLLIFIVLAVLPDFLWPQEKDTPPVGEPPRTGSSFLVSVALWALAHTIRTPMHNFIVSLSDLYLPLPALSSLVHAVAFVTIQEALRVSSFIILRIHWRDPSRVVIPARDGVFREVWYLALGWAAAEVCTAIIQGYDQLALYANIDGSGSDIAGASGDSEDDVEGQKWNHNDTYGTGTVGQYESHTNGIGLQSKIPSTEFAEDEVDDAEGRAIEASISQLMPQNSCDALCMLPIPDPRVELESALVELNNTKAREDLEELYGMPFVEIPVFVEVLQRLDSFLLSFGITLLMAFNYLPTFSSKIPDLFLTGEYISFLPSFIVLTLIHTLLALLYTPPILAYIGLPVAAYIACLFSLGLFFGGIGVWVGLW